MVKTQRQIELGEAIMFESKWTDINLLRPSDTTRLHGTIGSSISLLNASHQTVTQTNADLLKEVLTNLIHNMWSEITLLPVS